MDPKLNHYWRNIDLNLVPTSPIETQHLCEECVYFRLCGTIKPVKRTVFPTKPRLLSLPPSIEITIPCEKALIQHLMAVGRRAGKVGLSRHSCVSCGAIE
jgi:hypothetical protein